MTWTSDEPSSGLGSAPLCANPPGETCLRALGSSMFPCVPSGSRLTLEQVDPGRVQVGDILVYVGRPGLIAHRVLALSTGPGGPCFVMRADAQTSTELVGAQALAYRVTVVRFRCLSYATSGRAGRMLAHLAVERGLMFRALTRLAGQLAVLHRHLRWLAAQSR